MSEKPDTPERQGTPRMVTIVGRMSGLMVTDDGEVIDFGPAAGRFARPPDSKVKIVRLTHDPLP